MDRIFFCTSRERNNSCHCYNFAAEIIFEGIIEVDDLCNKDGVVKKYTDGSEKEGEAGWGFAAYLMEEAVAQTVRAYGVRGSIF